jgi:hypothetical protein
MNFNDWLKEHSISELEESIANLVHEELSGLGLEEPYSSNVANEPPANVRAC